MKPLLQLVGGTTEKFELVSRIVKANQKTVKSESKFRCLQGDLTSQQQIQLLKQVADGAITLDEMHNQAEEIKLDVRIKKAAALLLQKDTFEQVETDYGTQAFSDERRLGFFPAFKQLLQKRRRSAAENKGKAGKEKVDKPVMEVPPSFANYVEQVRQRNQQIKKAIISEAIEIGAAIHEVYQMDVKDLAQILKRRKKFFAS